LTARGGGILEREREHQSSNKIAKR
jgi:hypothetical protein